MSDRSQPHSRSGRSQPAGPLALRLLGDPGLVGCLSTCLARYGEGKLSPGGDSSPLVVWWHRGSLPDEAMGVCREAIDAGQSFLAIACEWGSATLGPLRRAGRRDPCVVCDDSARVPRLALSATPAELSPLLELTAVFAVDQLLRWLQRGTCDLVGARLQITPYSDWGEMAPPIWVRSAVVVKAECEGCGSTSPDRSGIFQRWCSEVPQSPDVARVQPAPRATGLLRAGAKEIQHGSSRSQSRHPGGGR